MRSPIVMRATEKRTSLLVLELDGAVRLSETELGRPIRSLADVQIHDGAVERMKEWKFGGGGRIIGVCNTPDIALGRLTMDQLGTIMKRTYDLTGALFDKIAFCVHHPDATDPEMGRCWCRLPSPGLIIESAIPLAHHNREMYPPCIGLFVGASTDGEQCAKLAGFPFKPASVWRKGS